MMASMIAWRLLPWPEIRIPRLTAESTAAIGISPSSALNVEGREGRAAAESIENHPAVAAAQLAYNIGWLAAAAQMSDDAIGFGGGNHGDHAETVVESAIHFRLIDFADAADEVEDRRYRPAPALNPGGKFRGNNAGQVFDHAATGNIRQTLYGE